ncbi:MAG: HlyC/CorC family transporter [Cytophagales bacterium]|nr:HlyC/CorC family transporter [Cytophagales bacterium]
MDYQLWGGILGCLLFSAFFSGIEIAFVSADKLHIELKANGSNALSYRLLTSFLKKPAMFIGTTLIGNTVALVLYGMLMAKVMEPALIPYMNEIGVMVVQTILSTIIVLATAEFVPKAIFLINSNRMLVILSVPMKIISILLWVPVFITVRLSKFIIVNVFKGAYSDEKPVYGLTDMNNFLQEMVKSDKASNAEIDTKIFTNALEFKTVKVRDCMIPRTEIVAIDITSSISDLKSAFVNTGHSKVLVYSENIDDIIGYCHSSKLFYKPQSIEDIVSDIMIVPETKLANDLMIEFIERHKSIALVVDEFGGTSGLVTIEDIIEEIFGEIQDEHDDEDLTEQVIDKNNYIFSARQEIDYLNEKYRLALPKGEYDTLGGFILANHTEIPNAQDIIRVGDFIIEIKTMLGIRIDKVKLTIHRDNVD